MFYQRSALFEKAALARVVRACVLCASSTSSSSSTSVQATSSRLHARPRSWRRSVGFRDRRAEGAARRCKPDDRTKAKIKEYRTGEPSWLSRFFINFFTNFPDKSPWPWGDFAKRKITSLATLLSCSRDADRQLDLNIAQNLIDLIGEPLVKHNLQILLDNYLNKYPDLLTPELALKRTQRIDQLEEELKRLSRHWGIWNK